LKSLPYLFLSLFFSLLAWKFLGDELKDLIHAAFDNQKENKKGHGLVDQAGI
jgi:hypothetical protein